MTSVLAEHWVDNSSPPDVRPLLLLIQRSGGDVSTLSADLERDAFRVLRVVHEASAVEFARRWRPDVVVLQVDAADPGLRLLSQLIHEGRAPVIVMAPGDQADPVAALEQGADDYVTEPAVPSELTARARAAVRRTRRTARPRVRRVGALELDGQARHARTHGRRLSLTPMEYTILEFLARTPGDVVTHHDLVQAMRACEADCTAALGQRIQRLRYKLASAGVRAPVITAVRGVGYRLDS
jgi:two-component system response regulator AdeR